MTSDLPPEIEQARNEWMQYNRDRDERRRLERVAKKEQWLEDNMGGEFYIHHTASRYSDSSSHEIIVEFVARLESSYWDNGQVMIWSNGVKTRGIYPKGYPNEY